MPRSPSPGEGQAQPPALRVGGSLRVVSVGDVKTLSRSCQFTSDFTHSPNIINMEVIKTTKR
jgi:hypothetical protein